jgi:hypothetical protein
MEQIFALTVAKTGKSVNFTFSTVTGGGDIDGHNRGWIDGSIPILSIDIIGHADHR